ISDASEHFSSSDDDLEETLDLIRIPKCEGYFEDVVQQMPDNVYFDHFRPNCVRPQRRIRDIFLGFPGSVHDSRVFSASPLGDHLAEMCGQYHLLGVSAYPCLVNLLTPFRDNGHLTRRQKNYNYLLATNRYIIEHCFGSLKQKWRKLYHIKMHKIADIVHFIRACAVLHNICLEETIVIVPENTELPINQVLDNTVDDNNRNGNERRYDIMNRLPIIL
ncbi:unnamed protein product, partial [Acanthoscelides obtectus]